MKNFLLGLFIALVVASGIALVFFQNNVSTAQAYEEPADYELAVNCTWGQLKVCMGGGCVQACCPENCKPYNQE